MTLLIRIALTARAGAWYGSVPLEAVSRSVCISKANSLACTCSDAAELRRELAELRAASAARSASPAAATRCGRCFQHLPVLSDIDECMAFAKTMCTPM